MKSLFDIEDLEITHTPAVSELQISKVSAADVMEFTKRYHYAGEAAANACSWRYGLWSGATLYGVVSYNLPTRSVCESVFGEEHHDKVWHMHRLACADNSPPLSESRLIGQSLRQIHREYGVWAVITYADTNAGHIGTVYQATNALYTGLSAIKYYYVDEHGNHRSRYQDGNTVTPELAADRNWQRREGKPKHRYLYILGTKKQKRIRRKLLRYPVLPYPKAQQ